MSPFRKHQQRVLARTSTRSSGKGAVAGKAAQQATPPEPSAEGSAGQEYAALRALLHDNVRTLTDIASHEARQPKKQEMAAAFAPWIEGLLEADEPVQDEILVTNMIWAIDYGDIDYALRLGGFAVRHGLSMPESYNRTTACFLAEDIAEAALKDDTAVRHDQLAALAELTADADMPDQARAKLHKALGRSWMAKAETFDAAADNAPAGGARAYAEEASMHLERALKLDKNVGVKTNIKQVDKLLKDLAPPPEDDGKDANKD